MKVLMKIGLVLVEEDLREISDCKVVVGERVDRQHRIMICRMSLLVRKMRRGKIDQEDQVMEVEKGKML